MADNAKPLSVATPEVGGVTMRRHILDRETAGLAKLAQRIGRRLRVWMDRMPEQKARTLVGFDEGVPIWEDILDENGNAVIVPWMPDKDFRENYTLYHETVTDLLKEQRERAKLKPGNGAPAIDDATFEKQLGELVRQTIVTMPKRELDDLMRLRAIDVSAGDAQVTQAHDLRPVEQAEQVDLPTSSPDVDAEPHKGQQLNGEDASTTPVDFLSELEKKP